MKRINEFEEILIRKGLALAIEKVNEEIDEAEARGKKHIFSKKYVPMVVEELLEKLTPVFPLKKNSK